jgi:hypothetical protein
MPAGQTALRRAPWADGLYGGRNPLVPGAWRWNEGGTKAETIITFSTTRPHSFFFAFAWCQKAKRIKREFFFFFFLKYKKCVCFVILCVYSYS